MSTSDEFVKEFQFIGGTRDGKFASLDVRMLPEKLLHMPVMSSPLVIDELRHPRDMVNIEKEEYEIVSYGTRSGKIYNLLFFNKRIY